MDMIMLFKSLKIANKHITHFFISKAFRKTNIETKIPDK